MPTPKKPDSSPVNNEIKIVTFNYKNATKAKLKNRRIIVEELDDLEEKSIGLCFKILTTEEDAKIPSADHSVLHGKLKKTTLRLTTDAALALYHCLGRQLSLIYKNQSQ